MLPKISIHNVPYEILENVDQSGDEDEIRDCEKQVIVDKILAKNPCISELFNGGHTLYVVFMNKNPNNNLLTIGLKVSPSIRSAIIEKQLSNIYVGNCRYKFRDRYHIKHCYHCQMLGHISTDCPNKGKPPVCSYCMEKHKSATCRFKNDTMKHRCVRCLASSYANDAENCQTHSAADPKCPVMVREVTRLETITDLTSKNVM